MQLGGTGSHAPCLHRFIFFTKVCRHSMRVCTHALMPMSTCGSGTEECLFVWNAPCACCRLPPRAACRTATAASTKTCGRSERISSSPSPSLPSPPPSSPSSSPFSGHGGLFRAPPHHGGSDYRVRLEPHSVPRKWRLKTRVYLRHGCVC